MTGRIPSPDFGKLIPKSGTEEAGYRAKTFSLSFTKVERGIADAMSGLGNLGSSILGSDFGRRIALEEIDALVQNVVKPAYQREAPVGGDSPAFPRGRHKKLAQSIQKQTLKAALTVTLRMNWYGRLTIDGRGALPVKTGKSAYPIVLPDGQVIFRKVVGPATRWESGGKSASERMAWAQTAYDKVERTGAIRQTAENIAYRILFESPFYRALLGDSHPLLKKNASGSHAEPAGRGQHMRRLNIKEYKAHVKLKSRGRPRKAYSAAEKRARRQAEKAKEQRKAKRERERAKKLEKQQKILKEREATDFAAVLADYDAARERYEGMVKHGTYTEIQLSKQRAKVAKMRERLAETAQYHKKKLEEQNNP
jgi:hypothetical protein